MPRKVIAIGETVLDIFFKNDVAVNSCPGGSVLNTAVSLGRLGIPVSYISDLGLDRAGELIEEFLRSNNVDTDYINKYKGFKTPLALAFLNESNEAEYSFYKEYPKTRAINSDIEINSGDIIIFGSFFALTLSVRPHILHLLNKGRANNALIMYDPNFRRPHLNELPDLMPLIIENIDYADIIRASDDDMRLIFGAENFGEALRFIPEGKGFIYTCAGNPVQYQIAHVRDSFPAPPLKPVSTVGAGDSFNAGIIYSLYNNCINKSILPDLDDLIIAQMIRTGISFAADVCMSKDNYIGKEFAKSLLKGGSI